MRKILALVLAILMVFSMSIMASAESTTTITTVVPGADYTLHIPADGQEIPFNATSTDIGSVYVTDGSGFADGKNLKVTATYSPFSASGVATTIPFTLVITNKDHPSQTIKMTSGKSIIFKGKSDGTVAQYTVVQQGAASDILGTQALLQISGADWGKALAGKYTTTITFSAEVVVGE